MIDYAEALDDDTSIYTSARRHTILYLYIYKRCRKSCTNMLGGEAGVGEELYREPTVSY